MKRIFLALTAVCLLQLGTTGAYAAYPMDCLGVGTPSGHGCTDMGIEGCCDAWGRNVWCQSGDLYCLDCPAQVVPGNTCGWKIQFYDCGGEGPDPAGVFLPTCALGCDPACAEPQFCKGGTCQDCMDPQCGDAECGMAPGCPGSGIACGQCDPGFSCVLGVCQVCPAGQTLDCDGSCAPLSALGDGLCDDGGFSANFDCDTFNLDNGDCGPCVPNCTQKTCGDDGCGGSCGTCSAGSYCDVASFACVVCSCGTAVCGTDPCGTPCGGCQAGFGCDGGACVACSPDHIPDCNQHCYLASWVGDGVCDESGYGANFNCSEFNMDDGDCLPCVPDCSGKACGDDGCGESCGACNIDEFCSTADFTCQTCSCGTKECGDNGCYESCGTCAAGEFCDLTSMCQVCTCGDSACGVDQCGVSCGTCGAGTTCVLGDCIVTTCGTDKIVDCLGRCAKSSWIGDGFCDTSANYGHFNCAQFQWDGGDCQPCVGDCSGKQCGDDGCGFQCGTCEETSFCTAQGTCQLCECGTYVCGYNQCGISCGTCSDGLSCVNGACQACQEDYILDCNNKCGKADWLGDGYCDQLEFGGDFNCPELNFDNGDCTPCTPDCADKTCGDDRCGGTCGTCSADQGCDPTTWECIACDVEALCEAEGNACGPVRHGCTGDCGTCPTGRICVVGSCKTTSCADPSMYPDCDGNCYQVSWVGDGYCDDGTVYGANFFCNEFDFDLGDCGVCTPDCQDKECGSDGCGGTCGTCAEDEGCDGSSLCQPCGCGDKECGYELCGSGCGSCPDGSGCDMAFGTCLSLEQVPAHCIEQQGAGCPGCTCEECVCAADSTCCDVAWDALCTARCIDECQGAPCPMLCVPDCAHKQCGSDGCGGTCGECEPGISCLQDGVGTVCIKDLCPFGLASVACCDGDNLLSCDPQVGFVVKNCKAKGPLATCGWYQGDADYDPGYYCGPEGVVVPTDPSGLVPGTCPACVPACGEVECGPDLCGGSCGTCNAPEECVSGQCCVLDCTGRECGDNGCGGSCGTCAQGMECSAGICQEPCLPDCQDQVCGDDGCGGSCGTCDAGKECVSGQCTDSCQPDCLGKECGGNGCGASCGTCDDGFECVAGLCTASCVPACDGKQCGDNGCGGTCGTCADGTTCDQAKGTCTAVAPEDVVAQEDIADTANPDTTDTPSGGGDGKSSNCSSGQRPSPTAASLLLVLLAAYGLLRRKSHS